jgi:hypothetical protein
MRRNEVGLIDLNFAMCLMQHGHQVDRLLAAVSLNFWTNKDLNTYYTKSILIRHAVFCMHC